MTEDEWETSDDAPAMLRFVRQKVGERKMRLLACACARSRWAGLVEDEYRRAVEVAERCADGLADRRELRTAWEEIWEIGWGVVQGDADANAAAQASIDDFAGNAAARAVQCVGPTAAALVREVLGNPFRSTVGPGLVVRESRVAWRTSDVLALARSIHEDQAFDRMPILADALQDAGCDDPDILGHCRGEGPHVRGCWVVDWILGKE